MRSKGGTLRAQWLGKLLRDQREAAGLSLKDVGDHIVRDPSTVSRMETGSIPARMTEVRELLTLYGVDDQELRAGMEALTRDIWGKHWWDSYARHVNIRVIDLAWLEARAEKIRGYSPMVIPGLLQTREYAEALMWTVNPDVSDKQVAQWLEFQLKRQDMLDQLHCDVILDEAVFHRLYGGPKVMRQQLTHLLDLSERPNITVRVLPFSSSPLAGPESGFSLFTMPAPFPVVAHVPTEAGIMYVEMPKADRLETTYARLERQALDTEESRVFLKTRMEHLA
jgi:transcriptional regulator with XRE-family HTH domain